MRADCVPSVPKPFYVGRLSTSDIGVHGWGVVQEPIPQWTPKFWGSQKIHIEFRLRGVM